MIQRICHIDSELENSVFVFGARLSLSERGNQTGIIGTES